MNAQAPAGRCQVCGCTAEKPCRTTTGDECGWLNKRMNVCNGRHCVIEYDRRMKAQKAAARKPRQDPFKVIERNAAGRAIRIVKRRDLKRKGRAA